MNRLSGKIAAVEVSGSVAMVDVRVGECIYSALLLDAEAVSTWQADTSVVLLFKETEVALAKNLHGLISLRNRFKGIVTALVQGQILTDVIFKVNDHLIASVITTRSARLLDLAVGDEVEGLVKANEMTILMVEPLSINLK